MSIFGQVWLWSAVAFLLGVLLTWVFLVRPAHARSRALERRLQAAQAQSKATDSPASERRAVPTRAFEREQAPARAVPAGSRAAEPAPEPVAEPVRHDPSRHEPVGQELAWREPARNEDAGHEMAGYDGGGPDAGGYQSAGYEAGRDEHLESGADRDERLRAEAGQREAGRHQASESLSSVLEPGLASEQTSIFRPHETSLFSPGEVPAEREPRAGGASYTHEPFTVDDPAARTREPSRGSLFDPGYEPPAETHADTPHNDPPHAEPSRETPPAYAFSDEPATGPDEHAGETTHVLPRRQPRTSSPGGFEPPTPIQPSMRPMERRGPVEPGEGGRSGSLFEPVVRPNSGGAHSAPEPPPARTHAADPAVPPGPFGPGSAMPLPGGASPADEFTVKASVTALRYCTADSPQFPRMVAEVWFRSAGDAERVGFRPLA